MEAHPESILTEHTTNSITGSGGAGPSRRPANEVLSAALKFLDSLKTLPSTDVKAKLEFIDKLVKKKKAREAEEARYNEAMARIVEQTARAGPSLAEQQIEEASQAKVARG
jgi:N-acetylglucosamine kinase-like BadF-type ATPase